MIDWSKNSRKIICTHHGKYSRKVRAECNMAMDDFFEEEFTVDECKHMIVYLLDKVKEERYEFVKEKIEKVIGLL